jgi:hypothetical protein
VLATTKHVLHGIGTACCSVAAYIDHALVRICMDIDSKDDPPATHTHSEIN